MSRLHLRIPYRCLTPGDPRAAYQRWQAFERELATLEGLIIARTTDHIDIAIPPAKELEARDLGRRMNDPSVRVVPCLLDTVRAPGAAS